jgi:hypothetical protein
VPQRMFADEKLLRTIRGMLDEVEHATVATVSLNGHPWNTPVYFARQRNSFYWTSRYDAVHSRNVRDTGRAFLVVYDSRREDVTGSALYTEVAVVELADETAIESAVTQIYQRRGKSAPPSSCFQDPSPHRVYSATAGRAWTNYLHDSGPIAWDERIEIALNDL